MTVWSFLSSNQNVVNFCCIVLYYFWVWFFMYWSSHHQVVSMWRYTYSVWVKKSSPFKSASLNSGTVFGFDKTSILPSNLIIQWIEVGWTGGHSLLTMKSRQFDLVKLKTWNSENDRKPRKINAILLNIKINRPKLVDMCGYELATNQQNFTEIHSLA